MHTQGKEVHWEPPTHTACGSMQGRLCVRVCVRVCVHVYSSKHTSPLTHTLSDPHWSITTVQPTHQPLSTGVNRQMGSFNVPANHTQAHPGAVAPATAAS